MQDFEGLGVFYLGKEYDPETDAVKDDLLLLDAKDLNTHAMIVGMTGSGKTGLAMTLVEEAAIDGIPSILIDPKGDLCNVMLQFPGLKAGDFLPWVNREEAARAGISVDELAAQTAESWKTGLGEWGQSGERIKRLMDAVEMAVYTPGSTAGRTLSLLRSFAAPPAALALDATAMRERIVTAVSGLLGLVGIDADPVQSPEHVLLSMVLDLAWREGRSLDLAGIIQEVQKPPFDKVGVFDLETFYPGKERLRLALSLNNLLAAPGFSSWLEGEPLDAQRLLFTPEGKPRVSVIYLAHLGERERMFTVTALLNEVLSWMRTQTGTTSPRALLYMDEIFGYFPPVANPPSKPPMLTLLKQARAFGLSVVLSTQNPVDLDYKGLANCGAWFIGRLQTERDKMRVIEGLEGALAGAVGGFDRARVEHELSNLGSRVFLLRNVHDTESVMFQTRWALSYLRGPMTLPQIQALPQSRTPQPAAAVIPTIAAAPAASDESGRPVLPAELPEYFLRARAGSGQVFYRPGVIGIAKLHFVDAKAKVDYWDTRAFLASLSEDGKEALWDEAEPRGEAADGLDRQPAAEAKFAPLPPAATNARQVDKWSKSFAAMLYQKETLELFSCAELKLMSRPGEWEGDFRARLGQAFRERRDVEMARLKEKYGPRQQALQDKLRRALDRADVERAQAGQKKLNAALSVGTTLLGAFVGRRKMGTVNRAASAARNLGLLGKENADVGRAEESAEVIVARLDELQAQFDREVMALQNDVDVMLMDLANISVRPRKSDITVTVVGLCWAPV